MAMVQAIMLMHPEMTGGPEQHRAEPGRLQVYRGTPEQGAMIGIVEDAKAERGRRKSKRKRKKQHEWESRRCKQRGVRKYEPGQDQACLSLQARVTDRRPATGRLRYQMIARRLSYLAPEGGFCRKARQFAGPFAWAVQMSFENHGVH